MATIRARLTLGYAALLMLTLAALGGGVYVAMSRALEQEAAAGAASLAAQVERLLAGSLAEQSQGEFHGISFDFEDPSLVQVMSGGGFYLEIYDTSGMVVSRSPALGTRHLLDVPPAGRASPFVRRIPGIGPVMLVVRQVAVRQRVAGTIVAGRSLTAAYAALGRLRGVLFAASLVAVVAALVGGWIFATSALRPVDHLTRMARAIGGGALDRRLHLTGPDDELHRLAAAFDEMLDRLQAAFERERRFTADVAHELRTPLTALQGEIDVALRRPREPADYRQTLLVLREEAARLTRLVNDMLLLARAEAGIEALRRAPVRIDLVARRIVEQFGPTASAQGVTLEAQGAAEVSATGDADLIFQALFNLIDNALRHTPTGGVVALRWEGDSGGVRIDVLDTGEGIAPEHLPHLFERFYRADGHRSRARGGAGLGLAIVRWIVEAHGGGITVTSEPNRGSRFSLTLPGALK